MKRFVPMKKLTPDEITKRLVACANTTLEREGEELFKCHQCLDVKWLTEEVQVPGHPAPTTHSKPCPYCTAGQELLEARSRVDARGTNRDLSEEAKQFKPLFERMCLQFGKQPTSKLLSAYWTELQDFSPQELDRGIKHASRACRFMPKIRDILDGVQGAPV